MTQETKTIACLAVALVTGVLAYVVSREAEDTASKDIVGQLFVEIENPLDIQRLRIVKFNSDAGKQEPFEVLQKEGRYVIDSAEGYPADARDHLVEAVNVVNNLEILANVGNSAAAHEEFGVVDPEGSSLGRGATGTGTRVTLSNNEGEALADFIIGKEVKETEGQYYVRHAGKDQVYVLQIDPDKLSTKFEDWIERDLLKLDPIDLTHVDISDYSLVTRAGGIALGAGGLRQMQEVVGIDMKSNIEVVYDKDDLEWQLEKLVVFDEGKPNEVELGPDEELDTTKLNDMKYALDDLEIVGVHRKVAGLESGELEAIVKRNPGAAANLEDHGFFFRTLVGPEGQRNLLLSNNGEIRVGMSDGVKYALRFGNVAGSEKDDSNAANKTSGSENAKNGDEDKKKSAKVLRYLLVTTEFDESLIAQPELEEVPPEEPPAEEPADEQSDEPAEADQDADAADAQEADAVEEEEEEEEESEAGANLEAAENADAGSEADAKAAADAEADTRDDADGDTAAESQATEDGKDENAAAEDAAKKLEEWKTRREEIIAENERKQKEFDEKVEAGKKRVKELNERFGEWYYVISDETYHKVRLSKAELIKEKEKPEDDGSSEEGEGTSGEPEAVEEQSTLDQFNELKNKLPEIEAGVE